MKTPVAGLFLVLAGLGLAACADRTPAKIVFAAPPAVVADTKLHELRPAVANSKGESLKGHSVLCSARPREVAEVSPEGSLRCLDSGDATVTLSGGGLNVPVLVKCRIPTEIAMSESIRLVLGRKPTPLRPKVFGEGGRPLADVPVEFVSSDAEIFEVTGAAVRAVGVGRASLKAAAGAIATIVPVEVVEEIAAERLSLADGSQKSWRLEPGDYSVRVDLESSRVRQGVTLAWSGAPCEPHPETPELRATCKIAEPTTVVVANPRTYGVGATVTGTVLIYRIAGF